jgi:hypothetical protein
MKNLGFDAILTAEVLHEKASDEDVLDWMKKHNALILTRYKSFPGAKHKVILAGLPTDEASKEAVSQLITLRAFPKGQRDHAARMAVPKFVCLGLVPLVLLVDHIWIIFG